jgi:hypothetical protein
LIKNIHFYIETFTLYIPSTHYYDLRLQRNVWRERKNKYNKGFVDLADHSEAGDKPKPSNLAVMIVPRPPREL